MGIIEKVSGSVAKILFVRRCEIMTRTVGKRHVKGLWFLQEDLLQRQTKRI